jgi:hypothetical protein
MFMKRIEQNNYRSKGEKIKYFDVSCLHDKRRKINTINYGKVVILSKNDIDL